MTTLSTLDVADLADATFRQVDHWARTGLIPDIHPGGGSGNPRRWTVTQAAYVTRMAVLVHAGMQPAAASALVALGEGTHQIGPGVHVTFGRPHCWAAEFLATHRDLPGRVRLPAPHHFEETSCQHPTT